MCFCAACRRGSRGSTGRSTSSSLYELLAAYGEGHRRGHARVLTIEPPAFHSLDEALQRLAPVLGHVPEWRELVAFLPEELRGAVFRRSALAATFAATLELARAGRIELRQDRAFGPIYLRSPAARRRADERQLSERAHQLRLLEALLFAAPEPLAEDDLARLARR